jgi:hypothetical protein
MTDSRWQGPAHDGPGSPYGAGPGQPPLPYGPLAGPVPEQLQPGSSTGPEGASSTAPGQPPGLFGTLFDFTFDRLVTVRLARLLYMLAVLCISGASFVFFMMGWSLAAGSFWPFLGWCMVIGVPVLWLGTVTMARVVVEYLVVQAKTSQDVAVLRDDVKEIKARRSAWPSAPEGAPRHPSMLWCQAAAARRGGKAVVSS